MVGDDGSADVVMGLETQESLDRAGAWVEAARTGFWGRFDPGGAGLEIFFAGDCGDVLAALVDAGCRPDVVDVDGHHLPPQGCLVRAEFELDAVDPDLRPTWLGPARAQLRVLVARSSSAGG